MMRLAAVGFVLLWCSGCGLLGPTCLSRQKTGVVTTISGEVAPRQVVSHRVPYGTEGSQNNLEITWTGKDAAEGPRIGAYVTKVDCVDFRPPPGTNTGSCSVLALASTGRELLIVTHGRGNPEILGNPPEYRLWIVGDAGQTVRYTISITWFSGPDC
jgi:hypothetical protein